MASQETINIIKSTIPVLEEHGLTITTAFYEKMFRNNPEMRNVFNMTHQLQGKQPRALADAILKYACYIDKLEELKDTVVSIAHKHVSLNVTPEMYEVVGTNLLAAMKDVLGDAATPQIMNAWEEAYGDLAEVFITKEEEIYSHEEKEEGGYRGFKEFLVETKVKESENITSFYIKPKDGSQVPKFIAGQYVGITLDMPNFVHRNTRNYSLSDAPNKSYLRISVKKEQNEIAGIVSNYLHEHIQEGSILRVGIPSGTFILKSTENPVILIAGGVGITPLMSMYNYITGFTDRKVVMIQCAKNAAVRAFKDELKKNSGKHSKVISVFDEPSVNDKLGVDYDYKGYLSEAILHSVNQNPSTEYYLCGPKEFMENGLKILFDLRVEQSRIHYEFFGPDEKL